MAAATLLLMSLTRRNTLLLVGVLLMLALTPPCVASACEECVDACCQVAIGPAQRTVGKVLVALAVVPEGDRLFSPSRVLVGPPGAAVGDPCVPLLVSAVPLRI
jgi:hypothetical protein